MTDVHCPEGGRHELYVRPAGYDGEIGVYCERCNLAIEDNYTGDMAATDLVVRSLNAAVQLTADEAESRVDYNIMGVHTEDERMKEYARRWRGDTEVEDE